ncbi:putative methyltransferase-like protein 25 [Acropora palmata]|uniref:putative methyltransferase-like protein 25 n=1 Tax=Acropora palmata TaxID=6131 RepID=UPI003D9FE208
MASATCLEPFLNFEDFSKDFQQVIHYLQKHKRLMDAHMVDFFSESHWESLLPLKMREDLELLSREELASLPTAFEGESEILRKCGESLKQFLTEASQNQLKSFSWLKGKQGFLSHDKVHFVSHIMNPKKSYEVEVMSDVINTLATQFHVRQILDLGSGKGYLSQNLALQYGLKVIGVDSSQGNTENANKRNEKLLKAWTGLVKKSRKTDNIQFLNGTKRSKESLVSCQTNVDSISSCTCVLHGQSGSINDCGLKETFCKQCQDLSAEINQLEESGQNGTLPSPGMKHSNNQSKIKHKGDLLQLSLESFNSSPLNNSSPLSEQKCKKEICGHSGNFRNALVMQDELQLSKTRLCRIHDENAVGNFCGPSRQNSFLPVTGFVDQSFVANGELRKLFDQLESSDRESSLESNGMFLVGLHACGDLVPMTLRIFVGEPSVKLMCIVGCCYHLVSQQFGLANKDASDQPGFPMSEFLKPYSLHLSRNATMVAQQAADRIASESKCPPPSVLFRAILQVILKEKFGLDGRGLHVGKAGSKCKTFKEYTHKCLTKLGLQDRSSELPDEELESYHDRFKSKENQLHAFHQLRATMAPCIESVFLLDRMCYLHEQGFNSACIVWLFDPVKSPRCYAIVASKA